MNRWVLLAILIQGALTMFGVLLIIGLCIYRNRQRRRDDQLMPKLQEIITTTACGLPIDTKPLKNLSGSQRQRVRGMILSAIGGLQGETRERLTSLYDELEFTFEDYRSLKDTSFPVRLGAIARLEIVKDLKAVSLIKPLMRDESPFVHFAALIYLLKQKKGFEPKMEAEMELAVLLQRYDTAREILDIYSRTHLTKFVVLFANAKNPRIRGVCLDVIQKNRVAEAMPVVVDHIIEALRSEGREEYAEFDFKRYTACLTVAPLPESEDLLTKMTEMRDPLVRTSAYRALFKIRPDLKFEYQEKLALDTSPQALRLYQQVKEDLAKLGVAS